MITWKLTKGASMDWTLETVAIPLSDVDRTKGAGR